MRLNPRLERGVGRLLVGDVATHGFLVEAEARNHHAVIATTDARVALCNFSSSLEGHFLPQARQVQHAQRALSTGTNKGNNITHKSVFLMVRGSGGKVGSPGRGVNGFL
ncbi:uncharacterized protein METZ01_LOCUS517164, partial [marine metagenome]